MLNTYINMWDISEHNEATTTTVNGILGKFLNKKSLLKKTTPTKANPTFTN